MAIKTFPLTLKWAHMVAPGVRHLAFVREEGEEFDYIPGQFISIHFTSSDGKPLRRSYSIATIPGKSDYIEMSLSFLKGGEASTYLFALEPGDQVEASGPYGRLVLRDEQPGRYIFVATGTGVTPYRSMLPELAKRMQADPALKVILLLGVRTHHDQLYTKDFLDFAHQHPNFDFRVHYSREIPDDPQPHEYSGYVQTAFLGLELDTEKDILYLCGNPHMIDNAVDLLKENGFITQQIRREKYIS